VGRYNEIMLVNKEINRWQLTQNHFISDKY